MQFLWLLVGLTSVYAAVPDAPRREGSKRLGQAVDCNGVVVFSAVTTPKNNREAKSGRNQIISFETPIIDKSIGFSRESGIFTSHCPGLYQLTFTATGDDANSKFSLRKRPSSSTNSWTTLVVTGKSGGSHTVFVDMEVGEQAAIFIDNGSLSTSSHTFSGYRVSKK